jgi:hypothetical protein
MTPPIAENTETRRGEVIEDCVWCRCQHRSQGNLRSLSRLLDECCFLSPSSDRVESHRDVRRCHLCVHESSNNRLDHRRQSFTTILSTGALHGIGDTVQVLLKD